MQYLILLYVVPPSGGLGPKTRQHEGGTTNEELHQPVLFHENRRGFRIVPQMVLRDGTERIPTPYTRGSVMIRRQFQI